MTFLEVMAGLAIAVFWVHMLLIAAGAVASGREVVRLGVRLRAGELRRGTVTAGRGPDACLAERRIHQRGRSKGDGMIHFHDRWHESELFGGTIMIEDGGAIDLAPASGEGVQVWASPDSLRRASALPSSEAFDHAYTDAQKARGWIRTVRSAVGPGDLVWLLLSAHAPLVAQVDPRRWVRQRMIAVSGFIALHLGLSVACTVVTFWPPLFGTVSKIGAFSSLVYFMLVQDWTRILREHVRVPAAAFLRGSWRRQ